MDEIIVRLLVGAGAALLTLIVGGWFLYIRNSPTRTEVDEMIAEAITPLEKQTSQSLEQGRENSKGIHDIQLALKDVNKDMALITKDFGYLTKMIIDQQMISKDLHDADENIKMLIVGKTEKKKE